MKTFSAIVALSLCAASTTASASPNFWSAPGKKHRLSDLNGSLNLGYSTHYNFNGITYGQDVFWTSVVAELPLTDSLLLGLNATYWDITSPLDGFERELDFSVSLTQELTPNTWLSLVFTRYSYLGDFPDEPELGLALEHSWKRFDFSFWYGRDFENSGNYAEINVARPFHVNELLSIVPSVQVGWVSGYEDSGTGFNHVMLRLDFPLEFTDRFSLTPYVAASFPVDALKASGIKDNEFFGGISLQHSF